MTRDIGLTTIVGDSQFDEGVNGYSEQGTATVSTGSVSTLSTIESTISISKGGWNAGRLVMDGIATPSFGGSGIVVFITETSSEAESTQAQYGGGNYSKNAGSYFLSNPIFSTLNSDVVLQDAYIDNANSQIKLTFFNTSVSTRTLRYWATWQVWQT